jgi:hypothetical protein
LTVADYALPAEPECTVTRREHYEAELRRCIHDVERAVEAFGLGSVIAHRAAASAERVRARLQQMREESA